MLDDTSPACYLNQVFNKSFHDLTTTNSIPQQAHDVLGFGLNFIPTPARTVSTRDAVASAERLSRQISLKAFFAGNDSDADADFNPRLRKPSVWRPPITSHEVDGRCTRFELEIKRIFSRPFKINSNLTKLQQRILDSLIADDFIAYTSADKGLGTCAVDFPIYIKDWCLKQHLVDASTYQFLSAPQAWEEMGSLQKAIFSWIQQHRSCIGREAAHFLSCKLRENAKEPFGYFYIMPKIHKPGPKGSKTRPVCSDYASLSHPLGIWVDSMELDITP